MIKLIIHTSVFIVCVFILLHSVTDYCENQWRQSTTLADYEHSSSVSVLQTMYMGSEGTLSIHIHVHVLEEWVYAIYIHVHVHGEWGYMHTQECCMWIFFLISDKTDPQSAGGLRFKISAMKFFKKSTFAANNIPICVKVLIKDIVYIVYYYYYYYYC